MSSRWTLGTILRGCAAALIGIALMLTGSTAQAQTKQPIKIGFSMALTGGLAPNGKSALLAMQIWEKDTNDKGGLLGRPVQLVYYDDQTISSTVPGIYTKLLDVDKVDLVVGPYGTNMIAPAMPVVIQHKMTFIGLLGLAVNSEFHYPNYFAMIPSGPNPKPSFTKGFFDIGMAQNPKPKTVAIVYADAEFSNNAADGARTNAKALGLNIVYDKSYPPSTTDYAPIMRAINATNPDIIVVCSYPPDTVGMVRAMNEIGTKAKLFGGAMVGPQGTAQKVSLGPMLNGIINYDFWLPGPKMLFPGVQELLAKYQAQAGTQGVDALGYYMAPLSYAYLQVMAEAVTKTGGLDQQKIADYIRANTFHTVAGDIKFGEGGEWAQSRVLQVQFQNVAANDVNQFKDTSKTVIVTPADYASGKAIYPLGAAHK
jgi:branched-chain amino acid transport system substrate-binding protein